MLYKNIVFPSTPGPEYILIGRVDCTNLNTQQSLLLYHKRITIPTKPPLQPPPQPQRRNTLKPISRMRLVNIDRTPGVMLKVVNTSRDGLGTESKTCHNSQEGRPRDPGSRRRRRWREELLQCLRHVWADGNLLPRFRYCFCGFALL